MIYLKIAWALLFFLLGTCFGIEAKILIDYYFPTDASR